MTMVETPYRFTVEEYHKLGETGIFDEHDRVELLNGEIIVMSPIGIQHIKAVRKLGRAFNRIFGNHCIVDYQNPFILDGVSEPQPDILLLPLEQENAEALPGPADIHLVVEVAQTSLGYDRGPKLKAYAAAGIREVWIVNLIHRLIEVYREPAPDGFRSRFEARPGESVAPSAFPEMPVAVNDVMP